MGEEGSYAPLKLEYQTRGRGCAVQVNLMNGRRVLHEITDSRSDQKGPHLYFALQGQMTVTI